MKGLLVKDNNKWWVRYTKHSPLWPVTQNNMKLPLLPEQQRNAALTLNQSDNMEVEFEIVEFNKPGSSYISADSKYAKIVMPPEENIEKLAEDARTELNEHVYCCSGEHEERAFDMGFVSGYYKGKGSLDLKKMEEKLDNQLAKETPESLNEWMESKQTDEKGKPLTYWGGVDFTNSNANNIISNSTQIFQKGIQGYICPITKIQCDDECCVSAENCHIKTSIDILSEPKQDRSCNHTNCREVCPECIPYIGYISEDCEAVKNWDSFVEQKNNELEVEKLAEKEYPIGDDWDDEESLVRKLAFIKGYNKAKADYDTSECVNCDEVKQTHQICMDCIGKLIKENQESLYTKEDILKAIDFGYTNTQGDGNEIKEREEIFIKSLKQK